MSGELTGMIVRAHVVGPFAMNTYVIGDAAAGDGVLVDPGGEVPALLESASDAGLEIGAIWLTHAHLDHIAGVAEAARRTGAPVSLHVDDRVLYEAAPQQAAAFGLHIEELPEPDVWLQGGESRSVGDLEFEVLHVPGHSPGHVAFWVAQERSVFSGDCVFAGSIGRVDLPGGSYDTLMSSIEQMIFGLGDDVRIYSGHGPPTTVEVERRTNPFFAGGSPPSGVE